MARQCHRIAAHRQDVEYESCVGTPYMSLGYHRSPSPKKHPKALWLLARADECHTFCSAERHGWTDPVGDHWAVGKDAAREMGKNGERVAYFPARSNSHDPWHG